MGFINLSWRSGSPSDSGRDIECYREVDDIDDTKRLEKYFVDAKHYKKNSVPVNAVRNVINWAEAKRPDFAIIITSNFLSNSTKNYLENYIKSNNPPFKIKCWENPKLEKLTLNQSNLLKKFGIANRNFPFLNLMHPAHLWYIRNPPINTPEYFFNLIENMDIEKRDKIFVHTYHTIINPDFKKPSLENETLRDLIIGKVDFNTFKKKTHYLSNLIPEQFLIISIVNETLNYIFHLADKTDIDKIILKRNGFIDYLKKGISCELKQEKWKIDDNEREMYSEWIEEEKKAIKNLPKQYEEYYQLYLYFCDKVVSELFKEDISELIRKNLDIFE